MTVSVIQTVPGAGGGFSDTYVLNISSTPQAGDIVIARSTQTRDGVKGDSISGLGATWTKVAWTPDTDQDCQIWLGVGATASGNVTFHYNGFTWAAGSLMLVRGLPSTEVFFMTDANSLSGGDIGPSLLGGVGQIVVSTGYSSLMTAYVGSTPASGWVSEATVTAATGTVSGQSIRIPSDGQISHSATATNSNSTSGQHLLAVIGSTLEPAVGYVNVNVGVAAPPTTVVNRKAVSIGVTPVKTETLTKVGTGDAVAYVNVNVTT